MFNTRHGTVMTTFNEQTKLYSWNKYSFKIICVTCVKYEGKASGLLVNNESELNLISEILNLITETAFSLPQYVLFVQTTKLWVNHTLLKNIYTHYIKQYLFQVCFIKMVNVIVSAKYWKSTLQIKLCVSVMRNIK